MLELQKTEMNIHGDCYLALADILYPNSTP